MGRYFMSFSMVVKIQGITTKKQLSLFWLVYATEDDLIK